MRKFLIIITVLALAGGTAFSQGMLDAYRYSLSDLNGTARYLAMGGAFGALGGDISAMSGNPAGLAVYHSSEMVTTLSVNNFSTEAKWLGMNTTTDKTRLSMDNIAYVGYMPTGNDEGLTGWNFGFSYNRLKNFRRSYSMSAGSALNTSVSDYIASRAYGIDGKTQMVSGTDYDPYSSQDWLSVLGYNAGYIDYYNNQNTAYYSSFGDVDANGNWQPYSLSGASLRVNERGSVDLYQLSFGFDVSNVFMFGATVGITDLSYHYNSQYDEKFSNDNDLFLDNNLSTDGTGYNLKVGVLTRPTDFLRLGVAYSSPTWYKMTDYYYAEAGSYLTYTENGASKERSLKAHTPDTDAYTDYEYRTPDKWLFSAAAIFGQNALLSVDYELSNYGNMKLYDNNGNTNTYIDANNNDIQNYFKNQNTLRVGAEVRVTPQFSVRAGAAWSDSPMESVLKNGQLEVNTVGTIPHFTVDKGISDYSVGLGYRFTPQFYTDIACVLRTYKEDAYSFSSMYENGKAFLTAQPASLKTHTTRVALSFGYKF